MVRKNGKTPHRNAFASKGIARADALAIIVSPMLFRPDRGGEPRSAENFSFLLLVEGMQETRERKDELA